MAYISDLLKLVVLIVYFIVLLSFAFYDKNINKKCLGICMNIKKRLTTILLATTILMTGTLSFETMQQSHTTEAAVNYYTKNQCTWYVFKKRASVGKPVPNGWGNAKTWYSNAKKSGYRVGRKPAKRAVMQSTAGTYGHVAYVSAVYNNGSIKVAEYNYNRPLAFGTRILSKSAAAKYNYIY